MQILTKKQVKYRRLVTRKSDVLEYCLGIEFQDKLFISDEFFASDRQQQAIDYCQNKYLAEGGKKAYLLVSNVAGLTVWREDKIARIVNQQSPEDAIADLKLTSFIWQMQQMGAVLTSNLQNSLQNSLQKSLQSDRLAEELQVSLAKMRDLEQKVRDGAWLESVESIAPFNTVHRYLPFN